MNNLVSCIVTTYKRPPQIVERALKSIIAQTYGNIEIIVVDDSPSDYELRDNVKQMIEKLDAGITYFRHEKNMGGCAARNTGIKLSKGDYIAFLDDDDEWLPEKTELQLQKFSSIDIALVYCGNYIVNTINNTVGTEKRPFFRGKVYENLIFRNFIGSTSFVMMKREVLEKLGGFSTDMMAAQDYELWLRIAKECEVDYVVAPLVNYYIHGDEQITKNHAKKVSALEMLNEKNYDYLKKHRKAYAVRLLRIIPDCSYVSKPKAVGLLRKAVALYPFLPVEFLKAVKCIIVK